MGDAGAVALADAIKINTTVQEIHLSSTIISDDGAVALADAIKINRTVTKIDLMCNPTIIGLARWLLVKLSKLTRAWKYY